MRSLSRLANVSSKRALMVRAGPARSAPPHPSHATHTIYHRTPPSPQAHPAHAPHQLRGSGVARGGEGGCGRGSGRALRPPCHERQRGRPRQGGCRCAARSPRLRRHSVRPGRSLHGRDEARHVGGRPGHDPDRPRQHPPRPREPPPPPATPPAQAAAAPLIRPLVQGPGAGAEPRRCEGAPRARTPQERSMHVSISPALRASTTDTHEGAASAPLTACNMPARRRPMPPSPHPQECPRRLRLRVSPLASCRWRSGAAAGVSAQRHGGREGAPPRRPLVGRRREGAGNIAPTALSTAAPAPHCRRGGGGARRDTCFVPEDGHLLALRFSPPLHPPSPPSPPPPPPPPPTPHPNTAPGRWPLPASPPTMLTGSRSPLGKEPRSVNLTGFTMTTFAET